MFYAGFIKKLLEEGLYQKERIHPVVRSIGYRKQNSAHRRKVERVL